ncbi:AbrB/MazE/SpoVT family DNA-binding domain-containing protein [uncultured Cellulomonas sp.]|uniref:AbrB/MazE/SpoVT family DNA-binding domain-containing protein n=1 Tax=uncultured Cellulomonas sp. TaxID=189682 RepID=UPI0028E93C16|nr:AbrB/MazE/SpoVT family DNA-binding domain-containing protein [uncultured Cellulomonas sp.]
MSGTYSTVMGDRGRLVVPAELRMHLGLEEGAAVILVEAPGGVVLMTRDQARASIARQLAGVDLVTQLMLDRRQDAAREDRG